MGNDQGGWGRFGREGVKCERGGAWILYYSVPIEHGEVGGCAGRGS
jgi:hypothetical protein